MQVACCVLVGRIEERTVDKPARGFGPSVGILQLAHTSLPGFNSDVGYCLQSGLWGTVGPILELFLGAGMLGPSLGVEATEVLKELGFTPVHRLSALKALGLL